MNEILSAVVVIAGLGAGNFVTEAIGKKDWDKALGKSYYQAFAITIYLLANALSQRF